MKKMIVFETIFEIFLVISLIFVFALFNAAQVYADDQQEKRVCCQKAVIDGETRYCQYTEKRNCDANSGVFDNRCEDVSVCRPVCCNVNNLGYLASGGQGCFKSVSMNSCVNELHGQVIPDAQCNVPECKKGCCTVGSQCTLTTSDNCQNLTSSYSNLELKYNPDVSDEIGCLSSCRSQNRGCCITKGESGISASSCRMITFGECNSANGQFYEGTSCVDLPADVRDCDKCKYSNDEKKLGCVPDIDSGEDVYEYDKCGNPVKVASLGSDGRNGDCDYSKGNICREQNGSAFCRNLNCNSDEIWDNPFVDENGDCCISRNKDGICVNMKGSDDVCWTNDKEFHGDNKFRVNGESWCEYDADAGPSRDLPGTRHYVHSCYEGEEIVQECKDYREEYCVQFIGGEIDQASCVKNKAAKESCASCDNDQRCCETKFSGSCVWVPENPINNQRVVSDARKIYENKCKFDKEHDNNTVCSAPPEVPNVTSSGTNGKCVPLVPPGTKDREDFCKAASKSFDTLWVTYGWGSDYHCAGGCGTYMKKFGYNYNNYCRALGDCGADFNLAGEWSDQGFARKCDLVGLSFDDIKGDQSSGYVTEGLSDEEATDLDNIYYKYKFDDSYKGQQEKLVGLVTNCNKPLEIPDTYRGKIESFVDFSKYKGSLFYNLENFGSIDLGAFTRGKDAMKWIGIIASVIFVVGVALKATLIALTFLGKVLIAFLSNPYTIVIALVLAVILIVTSTTMDSKEQKVNVQCKPWTPPIGNKNCNLCYESGYREYIDFNNHDADPKTGYVKEFVDLTAGGLHHCTPYLCWSLGQGCKFVETNDGNKCVAQECTSNAPKRKPLSKLQELNLASCRDSDDSVTGKIIPCTASNVVTDIGRGGYEIKYVKENTDITVGVETDKLAVCKWDWERKSDYEELTKYFDQSAASTTHTVTLEADRDLLPGAQKTINVICKDTCGNPGGSYPSYTINIKVSKMRDLGAPAFVSIDPPDNSPVKSDLIANVTDVLIKLSEPATCRWGRTNDPYEIMKGIAPNCGTPSRGCTIHLTGIQEGVNTFFIRCKDKSNNTNIDALPNNNGYRLIRSKPLQITNIRCLNSFDDKCGTIYDSNFTLEVTTADGGYNGKSICFALSSNGLEYEFFKTDSSIHTQVVGPRSTGSYTERIKCKDSVGNEDVKTVNFTMIRDEAPPKLLKLSFETGNLNLLTDEIAVCKYGDNSSLIFSEMIQFDSTANIKHTTSVGARNYVHVKCVDRFNYVASFDVYRSGKSG